MSGLIVVILAGGLGKRMNSEVPKVLHLIGDEPMLVKIIKESLKLEPEKILIVVGKYYKIIETELKKYISLDKINFVFQEFPLGTGDALKCCIPNLCECKNNDSKILVLSGDVPLLKENTMKEIMETNPNNLCITVTSIKNPSGYGRIITNAKTNEFVAIIEEKDCTENEKKISLVNCGIYVFSCSSLLKYLPKIKNENLQNEYYLTDAAGLLVKDGCKVDVIEIPQNKQDEILGVNTVEQLNELNNIYIKNK
jgi:UDP-N-acetylglucosamine diphosphorylase/glucosamine-1-phosphate N-acetyltransferase